MKRHFVLIVCISLLQLFPSIFSIPLDLDTIYLNPQAINNNPLSFSKASDFSEITEAFQEFYQEEYPHIYQQPSFAQQPLSPSSTDDINIDDIDPYGLWDD